MQIRNLSYREDGKTLFYNLNYSFEFGKIYGILSLDPQASTALLKLMSGILTPVSGSILIDGLNVHSTAPEIIKKSIGKSAFVFERLGLISNLNVRENLLLPYNYVFPEMPHEEKLSVINTYFEKFRIPAGLLEERPAKLNSQVYKLSVLIRSFIIKPRVILYDMPFTDLEMNAKKVLIDEISEIRSREESLQIFYSNTDVMFDRADKGLVMQDGQFINEGPWDELFMSDDPQIRKIITNYLSIGLNETEI